MRQSPGKLGLFGIILLLSSFCHADTHYVWTNSPSPTAPYTNWISAAHTIQTAIAGASDGDVILVTNGTYSTGSQIVYGSMLNRVVINRAVTITSVNGPGVTFIVGQGSGTGTNGDGAVRCVYVGGNALLAGFTLTNGHTRSTGDFSQEQSGGGAWCATSGVLSNCVLVCNSANFSGGGVYQGTAAFFPVIQSLIPCCLK